ncbi:hypothetical protein K458DRAFT_31142 [Lentithecium fluviatile CBS 122367]|uniref:Uncharacterized protein n=1 Tax=Lentithecium fluviatile CBS 122367 TaxID=1168545 RepID=A0A6G1J2D0_9PLEO|nr:hypothetical protein K458DRAFT_31142 [Lentithecium fluviatile CBS 122367]
MDPFTYAPFCVCRLPGRPKVNPKATLHVTVRPATLCTGLAPLRNLLNRPHSTSNLGRRARTPDTNMNDNDPTAQSVPVSGAQQEAGLQKDGQARPDEQERTGIQTCGPHIVPESPSPVRPSMAIFEAGGNVSVSDDAFALSCDVSGVTASPKRDRKGGR